MWLITGCSSGLGLALATRVLAAGHRAIATARNVNTLEPLASTYPDTCRALPLDVTDSAQIEAAVAGASRAFGRLDVLVNNAGYGLIGAFEELGREQVARNLNTNFLGALEMIRAVLPAFRARRSGHIINISAAAVISNYAGFSIYGAGKWALEGASEALALELKPLGIKVTIVQPGPFRTDFVARSLEQGENHIIDYERTSGKFAQFLALTSGKQPGDPARAADAILAAVESPQPPLRLVLGKYANEKVRKKLGDMERERAAWEAIGLPTDFNAAG